MKTTPTHPPQPFHRTTSQIFSVLLLLASLLWSNAASVTWTGLSDASWINGGNWNPGAPSPNDTLIFDGSNQTSPNNDFPVDTGFGGIIFSSSIATAPFTLGGNEIWFAGLVENDTTNVLQTIGLPMVLTNATTFNTVSNLDATVNDIMVTGNLSGTGAVTKIGGATLTLANGGVSGGITISNGLLVANNNLGGYTMSGGALKMNFRTYFINPTITFTSDAAVGIDLLDNAEPRGVDYYGNIGSLGYTWTKSGQGIFRLGGGGVIASAIDVAEGTLANLGGSGLPLTRWGTTNVITVENGATLRPDDGSMVPNPIVLNGGDGTSAGSYTHQGAIVGGNRNNGGTPTDNIFLNTITLNADSTVGCIWGQLIFSNNITGVGALTKTGVQPVILAGTNSYNGNTTVSVGTLQLASFSAIPNGAGKGDVFINGSSKLDIGGFNATANGLSDDGAGTAVLDNSSATGASTLTFGANNSSVSFVGQVKNTGLPLSIVKTGSSTATLLGVNSYSGSNVVAGGKLEINIPTSVTTGGLVSVADGAELSLHFRVPASSLPATGATLGVAGATTLDIDIGNFGNPSKPVINATNGTGVFSANGTITVNITGNGTVMSVGQFPLIKYTTRTGSGTFVLSALPASVTAQIVTNAGNKSIDLKVLSAPVTTWVGNVNNLWDIATTANWKTLGIPGTYSDGIAVLFDDTGLTNNINLTTTLSPTATTINTTNTYTFGGAGSLVAGDLSKSGTGTLAMQTPNTYNNTVIGAGTLLLIDGVSGTGSLGSGTVDDEAVLAVNSTNNITIANAISGAGSLTKQNTNLLVLGAANTYSGGTTISQGSVQMGNNAALGTPTVGLPLATIASGAALDVNRKMASVTNAVVISGAGVAANRGAIFHSLSQDCDIGCTKFGIQTLSLAGDAAIGNDGGSWSIGNSLNNSALGIINGNGFSLTKIGSGTLILSCVAKTPPSQFVIAGGGALFTAPTPIGGVIVISNNAWMDTFDNINNAGFTITNNFVIGTGGGQLRNTRGAFFGVADVNTYTGSITLNDNLTILNTSSWSGAPGNVLTLGKMTFTGAVSGAGGITNNGAVNTVTFNGANTYTGPTVANAGILQLSSVQQGGGAYVINDGGTLDIPSQTGFSVVPMSSLTVGSVSGATLSLARLTSVSTTVAPIMATNLTAIGTAALILPGLAYATPGQYPIIKYTGSVAGGGTFVAGGAVRGVPGYISNNVANSSIDLVVPGGSPVVWVGNAGNTWDIASTFNWQTNSVSTDYEQPGTVGDAVTFNDTSSVTNVNVTVPVSPALIVVSNSASTYSLGGASIGGNTSLLKSGPGTLTISNNNSFIGGAFINGGTLKMANNSALNNSSGQATVTGNGALDFNFQNPNALACTISGGGFNGLGTLVANYTNAAQTFGPASVTLAGSSTVGGANRWDIRSGANALNCPTNTFALTKVGAGIFGLSATKVSSNLGDIFIRGGTLSYESSSTGLGNPTNTIYISSGAALGFNSASVPLNKNIICSNGAAISGSGGNSTTVNIINSPVKLDSGTVNLNFNFYNGITFSNALSGAGGISLQFQSIATLAGTNTYTGNTTVPRCNAASGGLGTRLFLVGNGSISNSARITLQGIQTGQAFAAFLDVLGRTDKTLTLANNQTLQGDNGSFIRGNVVASSGSTITPGGNGTVQFMSCSNHLTLQAGSTNFMDVSGNPYTNDVILVTSNLTYGGVLQLNRSSATLLTNGQSFKLFNAATYSGSFASVATIAAGQFLTWNTSQLPVSGTISVASATASNPTNITATVTGGTLKLTWPGDHLGWTLQTNAVALTAPGSWYPVPGSSGVTNINITISPSASNVFYRLAYP